MTKTRPPRRPAVGDAAAPALETDIDRRQCKRVVPMKILGLGVSRTGTSSLRQALLDLGYHDVYHYASILQENPRDSEMWIQALDAKCFGKGQPFEKKDWDQLLGHCMAVTDTPCTIFYRELLDAYPDAKVILTIRDSPSQWWQSQINTVTKFIVEAIVPEHVPLIVKWFGPKERIQDLCARKVSWGHPMYAALIWDVKYGTRIAEEWYERYNEEIKRIVPKERLLVMNVKEGWKPLCDFLGVDIPAWEFPKVNTKDEFLQNAERMGYVYGKTIVWNMAKTLGPIVATTVALSVGWWYRS